MSRAAWMKVRSACHTRSVQEVRLRQNPADAISMTETYALADSRSLLGQRRAQDIRTSNPVPPNRKKITERGLVRLRERYGDHVTDRIDLEDYEMLLPRAQASNMRDRQYQILD